MYRVDVSCLDVDFPSKHVWIAELCNESRLGTCVLHLHKRLKWPPDGGEPFPDMQLTTDHYLFFLSQEENMFL